MTYFSSRQAAKKLGISITSLDRYIAAKKVPAPKATKIGRLTVRAWTEADIEQVRALLPKIANGRKTRYSKLKKGKPAPKRSKQ
jgi:predicted DNA-binding transcriptional regulator AlpA